MTFKTTAMKKKRSRAAKGQEEEDDGSGDDGNPIESKKLKGDVKLSKTEVDSDSEVAAAAVKEDEGPSVVETITIPKDVSNLEDYRNWFDAIGSALLNNYVMVIAGKTYRFAELEFYWKDEIHCDAFSHGQDDQKKCGTVSWHSE